MNSSAADLDLEVMKQDIQAVVGGNFSPNSIGRDVHDATVSRVRSRAGAYLDVFQSLFLGENFDAMMQSNLYLPSFLDMVADLEPDRVRKIAKQLLKQLDSVLIIHDSVENKEALFGVLPLQTMNLVQRLEDRRQELKTLLA